jgi:non-ribosomal peptide synthetase component E (peptide arylation enzyme)
MSSPANEEPVKKTADMAAYRKAYRATYRAKHKRPTLTLTQEEYEAFAGFAKQIEKSVPEAIKSLASERLTGAASPASEVAKPLDEAVFLLRNLANNINQIARRLNLKALQTGEQIILDGPASRALIEQMFAELQAMEKRLGALGKTVPSP